MTNEQVNGAYRNAITNLNNAITEANTNGMTLKFEIKRGDKIDFKANETMTIEIPNDGVKSVKTYGVEDV